MNRKGMPRRIRHLLACVDRHSALGWGAMAIVFLAWLTISWGH